MQLILHDDSGGELDAAIAEESRGDWVDYTFESRGGTLGTAGARNTEYLAALEVLLELLKQRNGVIEDMVVVSNRLMSLSLEKRRVKPVERDFPIELKRVDDILSLRRAITRAQTTIGREPGARGGGNPTKRLRITVSFEERGDHDFGSRRADEAGRNRQFNAGDRGYSGPPPSAFRKSSARQPARGFAYAFLLDGGSKPAIKIGFTSNLEKRLNKLNKEIRPSVTNCRWLPLASWDFGTERDAYDFEQRLNLFLENYKYEGEREIFRLSVDEFSREVTRYKESE